MKNLINQMQKILPGGYKWEVNVAFMGYDIMYFGKRGEELIAKVNVGDIEFLDGDEVKLANKLCSRLKEKLMNPDQVLDRLLGDI